MTFSMSDSFSMGKYNYNNHIILLSFKRIFYLQYGYNRNKLTMHNRNHKNINGRAQKTR